MLTSWLWSMRCWIDSSVSIGFVRQDCAALESRSWQQFFYFDPLCVIRCAVAFILESNLLELWALGLNEGSQYWSSGSIWLAHKCFKQPSAPFHSQIYTSVKFCCCAWLQGVWCCSLWFFWTVASVQLESSSLWSSHWHLFYTSSIISGVFII